MVLLKDFEVKVALKPSDGVAPGEAFKEYPNPEPRTSPDEWLAERYIEAKPGQEFQVEIYLKPSLKLFAADGLRISLRIDDHTVHFGRYYDKKWIATEMLEGEPIIFDDVLATDGRQHSRVTFSFGSLKAGECLKQELLAVGSTRNSLQMRLSISIVFLPHSKLRRWDVLLSKSTESNVEN